MGQPFLFFRVSYGDELTVHLGEASQYSHPRMKRRRKGSYVVSPAPCAGIFRPKLQPIDVRRDPGSRAGRRRLSVCVRLDIREIETRTLIEAGSVVASGRRPAFGRRLRPDVGSLGSLDTLIILPAPDSPSDEGEWRKWMRRTNSPIGRSSHLTIDICESALASVGPIGNRTNRPAVEGLSPWNAARFEYLRDSREHPRGGRVYPGNEARMTGRTRRPSTILRPETPSRTEDAMSRQGCSREHEPSSSPNDRLPARRHLDRPWSP